METITYLDTHVLVWLYAGKSELLSDRAYHTIQNHQLLISPVVELELQYLFEVDKISVDAKTITTELVTFLDLQICDHPFHHVVFRALNLNWTRDPFDRIITAQAAIQNHGLLTKDRFIRDNYANAFWDE